MEHVVQLNDGYANYAVVVSSTSDAEAERYLRMCSLSYDEHWNVQIQEPVQGSSALSTCHIKNINVLTQTTQPNHGN
jgi:hypothetical protein